MNQGQTIFSQVIDFLPKKNFRQCVNRYNGNHRIRSFTCYNQFLCMAFAQLTYRESLRDIDLCLSVFLWAHFRKTKATVKLHALLDLRGDIPTFIWITDGKIHDVNVLDHLIPEPGAIYIMDRAYLDFQRLYQMQQCSAVFVTRSKTNTGLRRLYSQKVDKTTGVRYDQIVLPTGFYAKKEYPAKLRRIKFFGTSENAVKTQIWIAISTYVLVAIMKKRMRIDLTLYTILQILSISFLRKSPFIRC